MAEVQRLHKPAETGFRSRFKQLCRVAAWLSIVAITVVSVVPPGYRPVTPAPHDIEHLSPFLAAGLAFGFGYERHRLLQGLALVAFSAVIELIQLIIPGRHARLSDFLVDAISACMGVALAAFVSRAVQGCSPE